MLRLNVLSLLAKIESVYGTDSVPTGSANAILLASKPTISPMEMTQVDRELIRNYFGNNEILPSSIYGMLEVEVEAAGSGVAGTPPAWGPLLRGCSMAEIITAAPVTGTAQAGGSTTTIKLAASASATDDLYDGMPISITAGTGNGQSGIIVDYDGTSKIATVASSTWVAPDATSTYSIGANVAYRPITNAPESLVMYMNVDGVRHKFTGMRGNVSGSFKVNGRPTFKFKFMGIYNAVADVAVPTSVFSGWIKPQACNKANTPFFHLHGISTLGMESFDFDLGNNISHFDLINATEQWLVDDRNSTGNISQEAAPLATKDWWSIIQAATTGPFALTHGTNAGNKLSFAAGACQLIAPKYGAYNNAATLQMQQRFMPISGNDELTICTY